jgi:hypothetical protein
MLQALLLQIFKNFVLLLNYKRENAFSSLLSPALFRKLSPKSAESLYVTLAEGLILDDFYVGRKLQRRSGTRGSSLDVIVDI